MASERELRHIVTRVTDEGLIIELYDVDGDPLFERDTATPMPILRDLADVLSRVFAMAANQVAVNGHVRSYPVVLADDPVWDLSTARAETVHRLIEARVDCPTAGSSGSRALPTASRWPPTRPRCATTASR